MDAKQINTMIGRIVEHQSNFSGLLTKDAQWVIQNPKKAIAIIIEAIENRPKPIELLLEFLGIISIPATSKQFIAREHFIIDKSDDAKVKISYINKDFKDNFLDKIEEPFVGGKITVSELKKDSIGRLIITGLGGEVKAETSLYEFWEVLNKQPNGDKGNLLVIGANIFFISDKTGVLWVVFCGWRDGGWRLNAHPIKDFYSWCAGFQVFFRNPSKL